MENYTKDTVEYLCEIASIYAMKDCKIVWNTAIEDDITYEDMFVFYEMIYRVANKNKSQSLLQSIYDVLNNIDLVEATRLKFLSTKK